MAKSQSNISTRQISIPAIQFDPELPITQRLPEIRGAIAENPLVIVCGETGSGKSTQLPKLLLQMGYGQSGMIGHTQPRRIAARSVAARIAEELNSPLGQLVGFKIRFADQTTAETRIKLMTDGVLLAELQQDRSLRKYDAIILDEAHERSLNIDLLIGVLRQLIARRKDLRVVITSATIDAHRISEHFSIDNCPAPVIEVSGRTYPVEMRYRPLSSASAEDESDRDVLDGMCDAVSELSAIDRGDILIFLATEQDIRLATKRLRGMSLQGKLDHTEILPLYSRLSTKEQNRIFNPGGQRRVILSTNVAESSLTVPRIKYVIDTGTARTSRYSPRSKVQRLPIEPISQASANQRAGRCGRLGPGICIRLFDEADFLSRDKFNTPEIRRTNLAAVILQTKIMRLGELDQIPFLDPPRIESIRAGYKTLFELGAVDDHRQVTDLGRRLSRLPIDPRLARMIVAADEEGCLADVLIIAAALEIRDPRERPVEKRAAADAQHEKFRDAESDFSSFLKIWDFFHDLKQSLSQSRLRKACQQNFLSYNRMREWQDIQRQLRQVTTEIGFAVGGRTNDYGKIHRALLAGLLSGIAMKGDSFEFTGAGGGKFFLWPGSSLFGKPSKWIVASEMVETEKRYLRNVAKIDPGWIESLAAHLVKRSYSDPHFSKKQASCLANEKVSLYGLPIVPRRAVNYGSIDPIVARQIFIEQGLVERGYAPVHGLIAENNRLIESITSLAQKTRDRSLIFEPALVYQFYEERLPAEIVDGASLERYLKDAGQSQKQRLKLDVDYLVGGEKYQNVERQFPDQVDLGTLRVPLDYRFEPNGQRDGVTFRIPAEALRQLNARQLDWLVPGMIEQKIVALIRSLPKSLRRNLVPAPETASKVAKRIEFGKGIFLEVVALHLSQIAGEPIRSSDFKTDKVDEYLLANVEVQDDQGRTVCAGRDLAALRTRIDVRPEAVGLNVTDERWNRTGIREWDFAEFPRQIEIGHQSISGNACPALLDRGQHVDLVLLDSPGMALRANLRGATRLFAIAARKLIKSQVRWLPQLNQMQIHASRLMSVNELERQLADLIARRAFLDEADVPRSKAEFDERLAQAAERTSVATQDVAKLCPELFRRYHEVNLVLEEPHPERWQEMIDDIRSQLAALTTENFLVDTPWRWLAEYPRYLNAIIVRAEKLSQRGLATDRQLMMEIQGYCSRYEQRKLQNDSLGVYDEELEQFRWMVEEYRVSSFAQTLGTSLAVSAKRLEKQWDKALSSIATQ